MFSSKTKLMPGPSAKEPIFKDTSGHRRRWLRRLALLGVACLMVWLCFAVALTMMPNNPASRVAALPGASAAKIPVDLATRTSRTALSGAPDLLAMSPCVGLRQDFGSALAASPGSPQRVFAILPEQPVNAFLSLQNNCAKIDVLMPEWYEIGGPEFGLTRIVPDPEMKLAVNAILADKSSSPLLMPVVDLRYDTPPDAFAARLADVAYRAELAHKIVGSVTKNDAVGVCLRLEGMGLRFVPALLPLLDDLRTALARDGRSLCLMSSFDDGLWNSPALVDRVDHMMVTLFQEPWRGSVPGPLAAAPWFRAEAAKLLASVGPEKLIVALGGHAVDWISGQAVPQRISIAEAAVRIVRAKAGISFAPLALNSFSSFVDEAGERHQIWLLDAIAASNSLRILQDLGIANVGLASLGEEEAALWTLFDQNAGFSVTDAIRNVPLADHVSYTGSGPFYRFSEPAEPGARDLTLDETTGLITGQTYNILPKPVRMERYGASSPRQIALTFDDGPDPEATTRILDVLRDHKAPATFFVVGVQAMSAPDLLRRAVAEGHVIGSHTFFHPQMDTLSPLHALAELNAARNLIEGVTGRSPRLYRAPFERGPGPITAQGANVFSLVADEGYIVAGSDIVPPDWSGMSADGIVRYVIAELDQNGGNIIVLHDGRSERMHTAEALDKLIPALRQRGYDIVPLPTLLGTTTAAMFPEVTGVSRTFKGASFAAITGVIGFLVLVFWLALLANFVRSIVYLLLARRRESGPIRPLRVLPTVTVVVPAFNEEKVIVQTVRNVLASRYPGLKCVVVDDGSTDDTLRLVQANFGSHPQVQIISQRNQGKWQALNAAYAMIDTEIAVCVDADTLIAPYAVYHIVQPFVDTRVGAVAGTVVVANRTNLLTRFQALEYVVAQQIGRRAQEHLNGILVVPGALGAWRVDAVKDIGFYSNETLTEDADLTIWMRRGGYKIAYAEASLAYTEAPTDVRSFMKQRMRWSFGNLQTLWKHRGALTEFGPGRIFSMLDMILFGYLMPLIAPVMDLIFVAAVVKIARSWWAGESFQGFETTHYAVFAMLAVPLMDLVVGWIALRRDKKHPMSLLLVAPAMNYLYRPLLYITVYRSLLSAVTGRIASWNKLQRTGMAGLVPGARR